MRRVCGVNHLSFPLTRGCDNRIYTGLKSLKLQTRTESIFTLKFKCWPERTGLLKLDKKVEVGVFVRALYYYHHIIKVQIARALSAWSEFLLCVRLGLTRILLSHRLGSGSVNLHNLRRLPAEIRPAECSLTNSSVVRRIEFRRRRSRCGLAREISTGYRVATGIANRITKCVRALYCRCW